MSITIPKDAQVKGWCSLHSKVALDMFTNGQDSSSDLLFRPNVRPNIYCTCTTSLPKNGIILTHVAGCPPYLGMLHSATTRLWPYHCHAVVRVVAKAAGRC